MQTPERLKGNIGLDKKKKKSEYLVDKNSDLVRVSGHRGSEVGKLRNQLYTEALGRISRAVDADNYFEAVALTDSVITDRFEALSQTLLHEQPKQFPITSAFQATAFVDSSYKQAGRNRSDEFCLLRDEVRGWSKKRNEVLHNYVVVTNRSLKFDKQYRDNFAKQTAIEGAKLVRKVLRFIEVEINDIKNG